MTINLLRKYSLSNSLRLYSPASIAKAYLKEMGIKQPKQHFGVSNKAVGIAMQSYYGGRAECRIRRTRVPVIHTDFTSQYPGDRVAILHSGHVRKQTGLVPNGRAALETENYPQTSSFIHLHFG